MSITINSQLDLHHTFWAVTYNNQTLIDSDVVEAYLRYNYGAFICVDLYNKFTLYNSMQSADFKRALDAYNSTYNPLDNYNGKIERLVTDDHGDETRNHTTGGADGTHKTVKALADTADGGTYTNNLTTTYDDTTPRLAGKSENHGGTVTTDDLHTTDTTTHGTTTATRGGETVTADVIHYEKETKAGNLGITTSQKMITEETALRMNPVSKQYLDTFVYQYCAYVGGAWF